MKQIWVSWRASLSELSDFSVPRLYTEASPSAASRRELHVFCDASIQAIAAVAYLRVIDPVGNCCIGFVICKAKLIPYPEMTMPRLELCGAVLAVELADLVPAEMDLQLNALFYYSTAKWFWATFTIKADAFMSFSTTEHYASGNHPFQTNGTMCQQTKILQIMLYILFCCHMKNTNWLSGPRFLSSPEPRNREDIFDLVDPGSDPDVSPLVSILSTTAFTILSSTCFTKFSS